MQLSHLLGAGVLIAAMGFSVNGFAVNQSLNQTSVNGTSNPDQSEGTDLALSTLPPPQFPAQPTANGHYVLVIEGDRNSLAVTFASKKAAPWAGIPKGFASNWTVSIRDASDRELAYVPLDVSAFATDARSLGQPVRVQGCVIVDSKIGMLLNVPAFAEAANYVFVRTDNQGTVVALGTTSGDQVRELAGGGR